MIKKVILLLGISTIFLRLYAEEIKSSAENLYLKESNRILLFTSEDILSSGSYKFGNNDSRLDTHSFPFTYNFKNNSDKYNFYINGSLGYSKYKEKNIDFRGSLDDNIIKTYAFKLGGGICLNLIKDTDIKFGSAYIYSRLNSSYDTSLRLDNSKDIDKTLNHIFNSNNHFNTYEFSSFIGYHPTFNKYKTYLNADIHYFHTNLNKSYATISDSTYTISKLKIGVVTPTIFSIYKLPLKVEFYASDIFTNGDIKEVLKSNNLYLLGTTFHLGTTTINKYISEVSFNINIVRGDNLDGVNFGFGLSF